MQTDQTKAKRRSIQTTIRQRNGHSPIDQYITIIHLALRLVRESSIRPGRRQRRARQAQLTRPRDVPGRARSAAGNIAVVGADGGARRIPGKFDAIAGEGDPLAAVAGDIRGAAVAWITLEIIARLVRGQMRRRCRGVDGWGVIRSCRRLVSCWH